MPYLLLTPLRALLAKLKRHAWVRRSAPVLLPLAMALLLFITGVLVASTVLLYRFDHLVKSQAAVTMAQTRCPKPSRGTCYVVIIADGANDAPPSVPFSKPPRHPNTSNVSI